MNQICLVEDEQKVSAFICKGLEEHGYGVTTAADGENAQNLFKQGQFDLLILDVMLPDTSGVELCRQVRETNPEVPILMLTALNQVHDKVSGLKAGADD